MVLALPLAIFVWIVLSLRRFYRGPVILVVLAVPGEFAQFVKHMESLRRDQSASRRSKSARRSYEVVLPLSRWPQRALSKMYSEDLGVLIVWGGGVSGLLQQALLLQPTLLVRIVRDDPRLKLNPYEFPKEPLREPENFINLRQDLITKMGLDPTQYVALAVYTASYDIERNQKWSQKSQSVISVGQELAQAVDYLQSKNISVILLGSSDDGLARIPREFPRLVDFAELGGREEVILAAGCHYFWTDNVGAWWLGQPFQKPVLLSNMAAQGCRKGLMPRDHLVLPVRYKTLDGRYLTFREMYRQKNTSFYKAATKGELLLERNSSEIIVDAHREMMSRLDGSWIEESEEVELRRRYESLCLEFPHLHRLRISSMFLRSHSELLN